MGRSRIAWAALGLGLGLLVAAVGCERRGRGVVANGAACEWSLQCQSELCLPGVADDESTGWPGGMCASACPTHACGAADEVCVDLAVGGLCLPRCGGSAGACRAGYVCDVALAACLPDCRGGWDCGAGWTCGADGTCGLADHTGLPLGAACSADADCATLACLGEDAGWTGGLCAQPCPTGTCPEGATCSVLGETLWCLPACAADAECRAGYLCHPKAGVCLPDCRQGWDCGDGRQCVEGRCERLPFSGAAPGAPCAASLDCAEGTCLGGRASDLSADGEEADGWPGGTCAALPVGGTCGPGAAPVVLDGQAWCIAACRPSVPCRDDYLCDAALGACLPDCRLGWNCGAGRTCGPDGDCLVADQGLADVGAPCAGSASCRSGTCLAAARDGEATGWAEGTCAAPCQEGACPAGGACVVLDFQAWCVGACGAGNTCRGGYVCTAEGACLPDCREGFACGDGWACGSDGQCVPAPPGHTVGEACDTDAECATLTCLRARRAGGFTGWTDGMCSADCTGAVCPAGATCTVLGTERWCLPDCLDPADCRAGYVCNGVTGTCLPDCRRGWDCGAGRACGADGVCRPRP